VRIAKSLGAASLPVARFAETPGCGIEGEIAGHTILLGSQAWIWSNTGTPPDPIGSSVFVTIDGTLRGSFMLENSLRPEVENLITELGGRFELALLSGDNERDAERFQKIFGSNAVLKFNQSPADKLNFIRELQQRGRKVMMVGDGLNDAGALKQADVGVAVVEQAGAFSPASDVILDAAELPRLAAVLEFSHSAARVIRAGFVISALYNLVGVSIAAAGLLQPMVCAILMPISSASVVFFSCSATTWMARRMGLTTKSQPAEDLPITTRETLKPNDRRTKEHKNQNAKMSFIPFLKIAGKNPEKSAFSAFRLRSAFGFRTSNFRFRTKKS
jgi:Cu+-exporting ATPase